MDPFPWTLAIAGGALAAVLVLGAVLLIRRKPRQEPLPVDWAVTARPVFSTDEKRIHRLLRDALPHHVVLAKLPLVRFCQPVDPVDVRYWFDLLGQTHVTFAVCSANGRVLAAVDLDHDRANSRRILQIKQSVLGACRIRYLRWAVDSPPTASELQMLIPSAMARSSMPASSAGLDEARDSLSTTVANRRAQRSARWQESATYQDSFFALDSRLDGFGHSEFGGFSKPGGQEVASRVQSVLAADRRGEAPSNDGGGVVVDDHTARGEADRAGRRDASRREASGR